MTVSSASIAALVARASYAVLHADWVAQRDRELAARLASRPARSVRVLLVNATMGTQLYPSIVDFFVLLRAARPEIELTSTGWFSEIHELGEQVVQKGLPVVPLAEVQGWQREQLERFDVILCVGPNELLMRWMGLPGLAARLVLLDLGFYHQLIEASAGAFLHGEAADPGREAQCNPVEVYTSQPRRKLERDLQQRFVTALFRWYELPYIPIGFRYGEYRASNREVFDVGLLGAGAREYEQLDPVQFRGLRLLFLGDASRVEAMDRLRSEVEVHVIPRVDEVTYAKLLALCRCVVLPLEQRSDNVLLSVNDALAAGRPLVATRQGGLARLEALGAPIVICREPGELYPAVRALLDDLPRRHELARQSVAFAREHLDMHRILERVMLEQGVA
jgi:glycosyltransferase involved in cell wall biosynthesis